MGSVQTTLVQIASDEDVEALVGRIPHLGEGQIVVSVQDDSSVLLTAAEFSRLLTAARAAHVSLSISTNDHLRRELARMLGWSVGDRPAEPPPRATDLPEPEQHTTADLASYIPVQFPPSVQPGSGPHRTQTGTVILDAAVPHTAAPAETRPPTRWNPPAPRPDDRQGTADLPPAGALEVRGRRLAIAAAVAAPIVVLAVVAGLLYYLLPSATVTLVPKERAISATLTYGVAAPGNNVDIALPPTTISATVTFDRTIQTTGERFVDDGTASGTILLTNPTTQPIVVPAQTQLKGANGMTYITQADATVPPADPYTSLSIGSATVNVVAASAGLAGNAGPSVVLGQLPDGAFYNNRNAISGGTRKRIAVVSPADTAALTVAAKQYFAAQLDPALKKQVTGSLVMVPGSEKAQPMTIQFDKQAGVDGTTITAHASQTTSASVFDPSKLAAAARDEVGRRLAAQASGPFVLLAPSVKIGNPTPTNQAQTAFSIQASGTVRAVISPQERSALASQLVGKSLSQADAIIGAMGDVASHTVAEGPSWLPRKMPDIVSRIQVVITNGGQGNANP
ncbi:MAG TPA: hypothetical protein VFN57_16100 [Thermomicrobiaceae bacterium]|nr:hypothetical protein [Thermomicrobiaceae bacterium]